MEFNTTVDNGIVASTNMPNNFTDGQVVHTNIAAANIEEKTYAVPVSDETIDILLISIMIIASIGILIGMICRKDVGGIKTKCCRTNKTVANDPVQSTEDIPLSRLA